MNIGVIIVLLTTLGDFGVQANPNAPSAQQIVAYAPADADFMLHMDLQAVVPHNYKSLTALPRHPLVAKNPEVKAALEDALREIEAGKNMAGGMIGLDLVTDIHSLTFWAKMPSAGMPQMLGVLRGNLKPELIDRMAAMGGSSVNTDTGKAMEMPDGTMVGFRDGQIIFGSGDWVKARLDKGWKGTRVQAGSADARLSAMLDDKPFLVVASKPSQQAVKRILREIPGDNVAADLVEGHKLAVVALSHRGVSWMWQARGKAGYERTIMASEGLLDVFRSAHIGTRGMANLIMAALHSYKHQDEIRIILQHEKAIMAAVDQMTGDGRFKVDFKKDPKSLTVTVKATGKKLSDVLPITGLLPGIAAGVFLTMSSSDPEGFMMEEKRAAPASKTRSATNDQGPRVQGPRVMSAESATAASATGLDIQTIYREVKRAHGM